MTPDERRKLEVEMIEGETYSHKSMRSLAMLLAHIDELTTERDELEERYSCMCLFIKERMA